MKTPVSLERQLSFLRGRLLEAQDMSARTLGYILALKEDIKEIEAMLGEKDADTGPERDTEVPESDGSV